MAGLARNSEPSGSPAPSPSVPAPVIPIRGRLSSPDPSSDSGHGIAVFWEQIFAQQGFSLKDPATAAAHRTTAATLGLLLEGARAEGVINDAQAQYLVTLTEEAVRAPDFL